MNCYMCDSGERAIEAVAICRHCGIALCREHIDEALLASSACGAGPSRPYHDPTGAARRRDEHPGAGVPLVIRLTPTTRPLPRAPPELARDPASALHDVADERGRGEPSAQTRAIGPETAIAPTTAPSRGLDRRGDRGDARVGTRRRRSAHPHFEIAVSCWPQAIRVGDRRRRCSWSRGPRPSSRGEVGVVRDQCLPQRCGVQRHQRCRRRAPGGVRRLPRRGGRRARGSRAASRSARSRRPFTASACAQPSARRRSSLPFR